MADSAVRGPLPRQAVIDAVERRGSAVPLYLAKWWGEGTREKYGAALDALAARYPDDICDGWYLMPGLDKSLNQNPAYRWGYRESYESADRHSIAETPVLLPDWDELDLFLADFPNPNEPGNFTQAEAALARAEGRYKLGGFWKVFHERFWVIRGMENLMCDYYDNMDGLKIIGDRLLEHQKVIVDRYATLGCDGIFTSDDLGHQRGPMMSPATFEELYLPLYRQLADHIHSYGMHFWLHSCGDNTLLMPYLVEAGVDVFHPVQKGCMALDETLEGYADKMSFLYGVDVQHLLPEGTPEAVRAEVRGVADLFRRRGGGLLLAAGNGILPDTPLENVEAMLDEMARLSSG